MKTIFLQHWMFLLLILLGACNSDTSQKNETVETPGGAAPPAAPGAAAVKPERFIYVSLYKNLQLRDQPTKGSKVLGKLRDGELVTGTGEQSMQEETAELRGIPMTSHYYKVLTGAGKEGWLFGAAVQSLYAGNNAGSPDQIKVQALSSFLYGLNPKKIDSGKQAWEYVRKMPADNNPAVADASLILLEMFMRRMEAEGEYYKMTETIKFDSLDYDAVYKNRFDMNKYPVTKQLAESGFRLVHAEGSIFPVYNWDMLQKHFAARVSPGMKAFIEQSVMEQQLTTMSDGGIVIPLESLADRAVFWENFNRSNPWFPYKIQAEESQRWLTNTLILGADNTPVFNYETLEVTPEFRKVWSYVQKKYPGTQVASRVKSFADLCASEGWKRTEKVEAFMGKNQELQ